MGKNEIIISKPNNDPPSIVVSGCSGCPFSTPHSTEFGFSCALDLLNQRINVCAVSGPETPSWCELKKAPMVISMDAKFMNI